MSEFEELYRMAEREQECTDKFSEDLNSAVSGYIATNIGDSLNGVPAYIGEGVSDKDVRELVDIAEDVLVFSGARLGQLAYASQELQSQNGFKHYDAGAGNIKASEFSDMFYDMIQGFDDNEEAIKYNLEVAEQQQDSPVDNVNTEASGEIPDFDIEDWQWPRENLWPF